MNRISLLLICMFIAMNSTKAQKSLYNIYEVNKGEILKQEYLYLEHLFENYYAAAHMKPGMNDEPNADISGVINDSEYMVLPFRYRNVKPMWDRTTKGRFIQVSNVIEGKAMGIYEIKDRDHVSPLIERYLSYRYQVFNNRAILAYNGFYNICGLNGQKTIETTFTEIEPLSNELLAVMTFERRWGMINSHNDTLLQPAFDEVRALTDSLFYFKKRDSFGVINSSGRIVVPMVFRSVQTNKHLIFAQTFNNGQPLVISEEMKRRQSRFTITVTKGGQTTEYYSYDRDNIQQAGLTGALDATGKMVIPFEYDLLETGIGRQVLAVKAGKFGVLAGDGKQLAECKYDDIDPYFETFYVTKSGSSYGLLNSDATELLPPAFGGIQPLSDKVVLILEGGVWKKMWYDENRHLHKAITPFDSHTIFFLFSDYNTTLNKTIYRSDGLKVYQNGRYGILTNDLNALTDIQYDDVDYAYGPYFKLKNGDKHYYFTKNGKALTEADEVLSGKVHGNGAAYICRKGGLCGVLNSEGKIIVPFQYKSITDVDGFHFIVEK